MVIAQIASMSYSIGMMTLNLSTKAGKNVTLNKGVYIIFFIGQGTWIWMPISAQGACAWVLVQTINRLLLQTDHVQTSTISYVR